MVTKTRSGAIAALAVVIWTFAATILRAIRRPNDFSEAHWLLDYRYGFIKRGLIGSISSLVTNLLSLEMNPVLIAVLSAITLVCMSGAMLYLLVRTTHRQQVDDGLLVVGVVFSSSSFVVMSAHLLGYFDALLYFLAIVAVGFVLSNRPFIAATISSAAILTHESYLLIGLPLVCLASVAVITANEKRASWKAHTIAICIPVATFLALTALQTLTTDVMALRSQLVTRLDSFGFVATRSHGVAVWQTSTFMEFFHQQSGEFGTRLLNPVILIAIGPTLLAIFVFIHASFRIRAFSPFSSLLLGLVCAPFAMHAVAWDTARISTYPIGGAFIAAWILAETRTVQRTGSSFLLIGALALVLNIFGHIPLMDGEIDRLSAPIRLLIYLPAIALLATVIVKDLGKNWFKEFTPTRTRDKVASGDGE